MIHSALPPPGLPERYRFTGPASPAEARRFCHALATSHYENFLVATVFVPRDLRPHFHSIYAYCRIADDLGDEIPDTETALRLLDWWEAELDLCFAGAPRHPVFVALAETNTRFGIPREPYAQLLDAFRQDQAVRRYDTYARLIDYCRRSAAPVGRLVLYLAGYSDTERQALSDHTCTALQLANFWQDVVRDYAIGRIYLPAEDMQAHGVTEAQIRDRQCTPGFASLMRMECERAASLFREGRALIPMVGRRLQLDIGMFTRGGEEVLRRIEAQGYDVLARRPSISRIRQAAMLVSRLAASVTAR